MVALLTLAGQAKSQLETARALLTGDRKDTKTAGNLLLEIVQHPREAGPETLAYAFVYLGYIDDRTGNRQEAIDWFRKAVGVDGASPGILSVAREGLERPVTWIRHLDQPSSAPPAALTETPRPAKAYVTPQPPAAMALARNLSESERRENFEALWSAIDSTYACFKLKSIDWLEIGQRYRSRLEGVRGDAFYELLFQLVNELQDTHSWLQNYRPPRLFEPEDVSIDLLEQRPFVVAVRPGSAAAAAGVAPGWEVLSVDGLSPAERMEVLRRYLHAFSSNRAFRREASRHLLAGDSAGPVAVKFRSSDGATKRLMLPRIAGPGAQPRIQPIDFDLTRQHFVDFGHHPSGLGYIRIRSFNGREQIADEFDRALDELRDTPGLLLDIRDNTGGFGQPRIVGRLLSKRTLVGISYFKNGPRHTDLDSRKDYLDPAGPWQYTKPIALLVNDLTGSAADLFASELRSARRVVTVGTPTHGNLSGVAAFVVLPCGLIVRISNGYIADAQDHPIEGAGNIPDITVEPTLEDFETGKDAVIDKAVSAMVK